MPTYESLPAESRFFKGQLFQRMADDLRLHGKAKRTVYGYVAAVRKLADFCQKSPEQIGEEDVRQYLLHLVVLLEAATGTQSVELSGIKFFFRHTLPRDWKVLALTKLRYIDALPEVITRQQVRQIIDACRTLRLTRLAQSEIPKTLPRIVPPPFCARIKIRTQKPAGNNISNPFRVAKATARQLPSAVARRNREANQEMNKQQLIRAKQIPRVPAFGFSPPA